MTTTNKIGGVTVVVAGTKRFTDWKLAHRALKAFHAKHFIRTLITGPSKGAEEIAYAWATAEHIHEIITVPTRPDLLNRHSYQLRNSTLLDQYRPFAVIAFPYVGSDPQRYHMINFAREHGINVWEVPADW